MSSLIGGPSGADHTTLNHRAARLTAAGLLLLTMTGVGLPLSRFTRQAAELQRYRAAMQDLANTIRTMQARARGKHRPVVLRIDAARGVFQITTLQRGSRAYETVEQTLWLPDGLAISEAPAALTVLPAGHLTAASILVEARTHNRLFRVTTTTHGAVRLHEEPTT